MASQNVLHINSSGRHQGSITREVSEQLVEQLIKKQKAGKVIKRDLATGLPFIDEQWIGANFTAAEDREAHHKETLALSDHLVGELQQAEHIVIASPVYNFSIPAVLKAWIDLVARARLTFKYTEQGPVGLLENKKAYLVMASGGVTIGSEADFATNYLKQVMAFIGITDVTVIDAGQIKLSSEQQTESIDQELDSLINA
ncbi:FMN-dependent NADH-azoreductase [Thalassotalea insulae]|uniref:FMN dependent NADH:quinone oxidoreductase n=1 Tax=Thalassotalea insulae TaxID=2056778 RepID=A0ABQ6GPY4_9GAMM|nr:NAD(P)H-dependent oxidoreductase [Thalassotalea insulae]GLX77997.1 FMN-dependent NADH-azoreductase [Thalassotalea insulae]